MRRTVFRHGSNRHGVVSMQKLLDPSPEIVGFQAIPQVPASAADQRPVLASESTQPLMRDFMRSMSLGLKKSSGLTRSTG